MMADVSRRNLFRWVTGGAALAVLPAVDSEAALPPMYLVGVPQTFPGAINHYKTKPCRIDPAALERVPERAIQKRDVRY